MLMIEFQQRGKSCACSAEQATDTALRALNRARR